MINRPTESNETVFEVRYRPNGRVLDHRGTWAEILSAHLSLPHWAIVRNRVDIHTADKSQHVFVSLRNAGLMIQDAPTNNLFADKAQRFLRRLLSLEGFDNPLPVDRVGVRHKVAVPFDGTFEALVDHFASDYLQLAPGLKQSFGDSQLVDIGAPLNFTDELGHFNTVTGPMKEEQFKDFLRKTEGLPPVGVYIDVDYWDKPSSPLNESQLTAKVTAFAAAAFRRTATIRQLALAPASVQA